MSENQEHNGDYGQYQGASIDDLIAARDNMQAIFYARVENADNEILAFNQRMKQHIYEACRRLDEQLYQDHQERDRKYQALEDQHIDLQQQHNQSLNSVAGLKQENELYENFFTEMEKMMKERSGSTSMESGPGQVKVQVTPNDESGQDDTSKKVEMCQLRIQKLKNFIGHALGTGGATIDMGNSIPDAAAAMEVEYAVEAKVMRNENPVDETVAEVSNGAAFAGDMEDDVIILAEIPAKRVDRGLLD